MQRCKASGIFTIEVEAKNYGEAKTKAHRILKDSGISGHVIDVEIEKEAKNA